MYLDDNNDDGYFVIAAVVYIQNKFNKYTYSTNL